MSERVIIADHDLAWPERFEEFRAIFAEAFGTLAVAIEHVGSTSVPGLAAKPIIDIDVAVASERDVQEGINRFASIGYEHEGDLGIVGREAFLTPRGTFTHHPYLVVADSREFMRHIAFRDRLRQDEKARHEYEALKRELAVRPDVDHSNYSALKTDFIERILAEELGTGR